MPNILYINPDDFFGNSPYPDEYPQAPYCLEDGTRQDIANAIGLGHELGHFFGYHDEPNGTNVRENENPIRRDLHVPDRMTYQGNPIYP